jgi:hypothetical protein
MGGTQAADEPRERDRKEDVESAANSLTTRTRLSRLARHSRNHSPHDQPNPIHPRPLLRAEHELRSAKPRPEGFHLPIRALPEFLDRGVFRCVTEIRGEFACSLTKAFNDGLDLSLDLHRSGGSGGGGGGLEGGISVGFCRGRRGGKREFTLVCWRRPRTQTRDAVAVG